MGCTIWYSTVWYNYINGSTPTEVGYAGKEIWVEDTINAYGSDTFNYSLSGKNLVLQSEKMIVYYNRHK